MTLHEFSAWRLPVMAVAAALCSGTAARAQECAYLGATENFNSIAYCVSSVLGDIGNNSYGPENLFDMARETAWCEGARGSGAGQILSLRIDNGGPFRRFLIENGYAKNDTIFRSNARPKTIEIRTDTGVNFRHVLEDTDSERWVYLPEPGTYSVLQIRVIDVYPGTKYEDMCISTVLVDFDYEKYLEQENLLGTTPDAAPAPPDLPETPPEPAPALPQFEDLPELPKL